MQELVIDGPGDAHRARGRPPDPGGLRRRVAAAARGRLRRDLHRPAVQHGLLEDARSGCGRSTVRPADSNGFGGRRYTRDVVSALSYGDTFDDFVAFIAPKLERATGAARRARDALLPHRLSRGPLLQGAARTGSSAATASSTRSSGRTTTAARTKRSAGRRSTTRSSSTSRTRRATAFNATRSTAMPYMAPGLVGPEKAARGKLPTDTWWHTIVPTNGRERTGYPTQKPLGILRRIVRGVVESRRLVLDFFAGRARSGRRRTVSAAASSSSTRTRRRSTSCVSG